MFCMSPLLQEQVQWPVVLAEVHGPAQPTLLMNSNSVLAFLTSYLPLAQR